MKIIAGLGNPGAEYRETRHNIGFMFLDYLKDELGAEDFKDSKFKALISEGNISGEKVILLKPMTYMNLSGESVASILNFYKLDQEEDFIVIFDDMSMDFGKIRFRSEGSDGGHNGIKSIAKSLGGSVFKRIKIGVGKDMRYNAADWVLSKFTGEELKALVTTYFPQTEEILKEKFLLS